VFARHHLANALEHPLSDVPAVAPLLHDRSSVRLGRSIAARCAAGQLSSSAASSAAWEPPARRTREAEDRQRLMVLRLRPRSGRWGCGLSSRKHAHG
jgi:hypothetical protein